jgi:SAM-dependent methyltransferase
MDSLMTASTSEGKHISSQDLKYACPICHGKVIPQETATLACQDCMQQFPVRNGQPDFRLDALLTEQEEVSEDETEKWQNQIKNTLRRHPGLFRFLVLTLGTSLQLGESSQKFINALGHQAQILSVGAGVLRLKGNVTHLDYEPHSHLEVVGDAHYLPFPTQTFDAVVCETVLEHVVEPERVINEIFRVLKPGGKVYILMPFMYCFHAAPNDFHRMTHRGLAYRMRAFEIEKLSVFAGPTSALTNVLVEWCALFFSFGSRRLYRVLSLFFLILFVPLKLIDFVLTFHPEAVRLASVLLCIGRKPMHPQQ